MKSRLVAVAALFIAGPAFAQTSGTVTNHAFAIGKGAGQTGYSSLLCASAQLAVGQTAADPICRTVSGDATLSAAGALTFATVNANVGSFGSATQCAAFTVNAKGLITAASAVTCTPAIGSITGLGTGVATALGVNIGSAGAFITFNGAGGTPSSMTGTNITGVPIATGISGLGAGCATWLATPSSANLRGCINDETGTGLAYFQGGALGTPASGTATNLTGLPLSGLNSQAAWSFVVNNTSGSASPTAVDIPSFTWKATPAGTDLVVISDQAASGALKRVTVSSLATSSGVSSIAGNTGAFTLSNGITNSTNDIRLSLNSAVLSAQPTNPGGTSSATPVMMGLGVTTCRFTPTYSTRVEFEIFGDVTNGAAGTVSVRIAFGTGAGPANGAAATGTTFGSVLAPSISGSSDVKVFKNGGIVTGLSAGTTYWFDVQLSTSANTANLLVMTCNAKEIL